MVYPTKNTYLQILIIFNNLTKYFYWQRLSMPAREVSSVQYSPISPTDQRKKGNQHSIVHFGKEVVNDSACSHTNDKAVKWSELMQHEQSLDDISLASFSGLEMAVKTRGSDIHNSSRPSVYGRSSTQMRKSSVRIMGSNPEVRKINLKFRTCSPRKNKNKYIFNFL